MICPGREDDLVSPVRPSTRIWPCAAIGIPSTAQAGSPPSSQRAAQAGEWCGTGVLTLPLAAAGFFVSIGVGDQGCTRQARAEDAHHHPRLKS